MTTDPIKFTAFSNGWCSAGCGQSNLGIEWRLWPNKRLPIPLGDSQAKLTMRPKPNKSHDVSGRLLIDQHQIGLDVTIPMVFPFAG